MRADPIAPEALLERYPPVRREAADALRAIVRRAAPDALEAVRPGWGLIGYDVPIGRRTRYFAFVWAESEHVHLGFEYGAWMDDRDGRLGGGFLKKVRFVTYLTAADVEADAPELEALVREAARVARLTRTERVAIELDRDG